MNVESSLFASLRFGEYQHMVFPRNMTKHFRHRQLVSRPLIKLVTKLVTNCICLKIKLIPTLHIFDIGIFVIDNASSNIRFQIHLP